MPLAPAQLIILALELALILGGAALGLGLLGSARGRQRWLSPRQLPHWPVSVAEFLLAALLVFTGGFVAQFLLQGAFGRMIQAAADRTGLEVFVYGAGFHLGILGACAYSPVIRRRLHGEYGGTPPPLRTAPPVSWSTVLRPAAGTMLIALPVLTLISLGWTWLLRRWGLPEEPQDLIGIFTATRSPLVIAGMLLVACVLAPISEELIFRAGLYRYVRQGLGRVPALLVSGLGFGMLHGNWAGFLPLAALGMMLALAYEATGTIRVAIVAHALFNLHTILLVLSGLPQALP